MNIGQLLHSSVWSATKKNANLRRKDLWTHTEIQAVTIVTHAGRVFTEYMALTELGFDNLMHFRVSTFHI